MTPGLERLKLDAAAREVLQLADDCGLHPHLSTAGPGYGTRPTEVIIDSRTPGGLFGTIVIGTGGQVLLGHLVHGNWGTERHHEGLAEVQAVITSWAALTRHAT
jgi:uncharacterized membrane protein YeaQ/YmgE (transglycosylase-associated protein family)